MSDDELTIALERFDLQRYVTEKGAQRGGRDEALLECPVCMHRDPKISVNLNTKLWHCFICEEYTVGPGGFRKPLKGAGNLVGLVALLEGLKIGDAIRFIIARADAPTDDLDIPEETARGVDTWERVATNLPDGAVPVDGTLPYLLRRGISPEDARCFGLHYVPWTHGGWLAGRLVFPVWEGGRVLYWQARAMWDAQEHAAWWPGTKFKKTLNPSRFYCAMHGPFPRGGSHCATCGAPQQFGSSDVLLNIDIARQFPRVAICEGPTSAIRAGPSAVATFGKHLHPMQIARLVGAGVRAVDFLYDGPSPKEPRGAWPEMVAAAAQLAPHFDVRLVFLPRGDPGDWPREHLDWFRARAMPLANVDASQFAI